MGKKNTQHRNIDKNSIDVKKNIDRVKKITAGAVHYSKIVNRSIIYVYINDNNKLSEIEVYFGAKNFMHLTGMECFSNDLAGDKNVLSTEDFYNQALAASDKISKGLNHRLLIHTENDSTTDSKLEVIFNIQFLLYCNKVKVSDKRLCFTKTTSEGHLRSNNAIVCLTQHKKRYPNSLRNLRKDRITPKSLKVVCIYEPSTEEKKHEILCSTPDFDKRTGKKGYRFK